MRIREKIYLDHQASCPLDPAVFEKMRSAWMDGVGNPHSSEHAFGWDAAKAVDTASAQLAQLIGADSDEIFFTSGATEANNLALKGYSAVGRRKIITSTIEHKCVLETLRHLREAGKAEVVTIGVNSEGKLDLDALALAADEDTHTISIIGVNNEIGTVQSIDEVAAIARSVGARLHLDLAQAVTAVPLTNLAHSAETISLSAHKFYGPMGVGCLYVNRRLHPDLAPILHGGGQQRGLRPGTLPVPLCVGMGSAAASYLEEDARDREHAALRAINCYLWEKIQRLPFETHLNGPALDKRHPGNLNVSFSGFDAQDIIGAVQPKLAISSGSACTSGMPEPSYVIKALGVSDDRLHSAIRLSIGRWTTRADIDDGVAILASALERLSV